jgi:ABC-type multidrug transport system fused ATPase/permease subunit
VTLQPSFYHRTPTGDIMARATNDLAAVRMAAGPAVMYLTDTITRAVLAVPLILGSMWALVPAVLGCALWIDRTALEDLTLRQELSGYVEYVRKVRYRLVPGVW